MAKPRASVRAGAGQPAQFAIEAGEITRLLTGAKEFDKALVRGIRRNLRTAAKPAVDAVRSEVRSIPTKGIRSNGVRDAVAQGVGLRISAAKSGGSVTISASPRRLPANRKAMARLLNTPSWRHPVFGNRDEWVEQTSRPYFGSVIYRYRDELRAAVEDALNDAAKALGTSIRRR